MQKGKRLIRPDDLRPWSILIRKKLWHYNIMVRNDVGQNHRIPFRCNYSNQCHFSCVFVIFVQSFILFWIIRYGFFRYQTACGQFERLVRQCGHWTKARCSTSDWAALVFCLWEFFKIAGNTWIKTQLLCFSSNASGFFFRAFKFMVGPRYFQRIFVRFCNRVNIVSSSAIYGKNIAQQRSRASDLWPLGL